MEVRNSDYSYEVETSIKFFNVFLEVSVTYLIYLTGLVIGWSHLVINAIYLIGLFIFFIAIILEDCDLVVSVEKIGEVDGKASEAIAPEIAAAEAKLSSTCDAGKPREKLKR